MNLKERLEDWPSMAICLIIVMSGVVFMALVGSIAPRKCLVDGEYFDVGFAAGYKCLKWEGKNE